MYVCTGLAVICKNIRQKLENIKKNKKKWEETKLESIPPMSSEQEWVMRGNQQQ